MAIRVGIDTGGTFTDLVAVDEHGRSFLAKVPSNPADPVGTVAAALREAGLEPSDVEVVVVGTTIGINAVLTRRGARVLYLTTKGFEDIPYIQRINRKHHYDFHWRKPTPLVRRRDCLGIPERLDEQGEVLVPPMSRAIACSTPEARATYAPPMPLPAIPESNRCAGRERASSASARPPFDFRSDHVPGTPAARRAPETPRTYPSKSGFVKASTVTVVPRSYSRQIGATSCDSDTGSSGYRARTASRTRSSCSGFR